MSVQSDRATIRRVWQPDSVDSNDVAMSSEEPLPGGNVTQPSRVGQYVHRATGEWTPAVHALLHHLEAVGFTGAPRVVGFDDTGREMLTYLDGEAGSRVFPAALRAERGLTALGSSLRAFHDAARSFEPAPDAVYRVGPKPLGPGEIVCHGDPGFWNMVWRGEEIVGLIDWDFAEPAAPIVDVALAAMPVVPFGDEEAAARFELVPPVDRRGRLAAVCEGYGGITPREVVQAGAETMELEIDRLRRFGGAGREPWASSLAAGRQLHLFESVAAWIEEHGSSLI